MCGLVCGSNITEIVGNEKATIKRYFSEVDVATLENMLTEKVIHGKSVADFKKLFTQQPLIISNFHRKYTYNRICRTTYQRQI